MKVFLHLYGFILLGSSIQSDNHNWAIEKLTSVRINSYNQSFMHLYGFILLGGSIESEQQWCY